MIRDHFRVLAVDLSSGRGNVLTLDGRETYIGGSGLAALLFDKFGRPDRPWDAPEQPLIFTIGPLTGYFPLMSKCVCAFKSPYHDQYAESHAGGRSALALRFADLDALVVTGRAATPSCLPWATTTSTFRMCDYLYGEERGCGRQDAAAHVSGFRPPQHFAHRPGRGNRSAMAGINVDTYRHFGRLGGGAVMGAKNLKGIVIEGDAAFSLPAGKAYRNAVQDVYARYDHHRHDEQVPQPGDRREPGLPQRDQGPALAQSPADQRPGHRRVTGERFADDTLLRNAACAGCPVGCIHVGFCGKNSWRKTSISTARWPMTTSRFLPPAPCWA
jgi:aldehyde:ferredoxin oxidoreductase